MNQDVAGSRSRAVLACVATLLLGATLTGCSGDPATVDFAQTAASPDTAPTVTVTDQVTTTVTTTATQTLPVTTTATETIPVRVTTTVTPPPPTYAPLSPNTPPLPPIRTDLDRRLADGAARAIVADVAAIDQLFGDTADVSPRLDLLDRDLATLLSAGTLPRVDGPSYIGRILSLRVFTAQAAQDAPTHRVAARGRWDVIRPEIATLLAQVTLGLGTTYALPTATP